MNNYTYPRDYSHMRFKLNEKVRMRTYYDNKVRKAVVVYVDGSKYPSKYPIMVRLLRTNTEPPKYLLCETSDIIS